MPEALAQRIALLPALAAATDIHIVAEATRTALERAASVFFEVSEQFRIGEMAAWAGTIPLGDQFDVRVLDRALGTVADAHRRLAIDAIATGADDPLAAWLGANQHAVDRAMRALAPLIEAGKATLSRLSFAADLLADLAGHGRPEL